MVQRSDRARNIFNSNDRSNLNGGTFSAESSESEFVEGEKPWPPEEREGRARVHRQVPRVPRPHSHLFRLRENQSRRGKHARRWENSMFLRSLHPISEEDFEMSSSILPSHHSAFSRLHCSDKHMQIWNSFTCRSEEDQESLTPSSSSWPQDNTILSSSNSTYQDARSSPNNQDATSSPSSHSYQDAKMSPSNSSYQDADNSLPMQTPGDLTSPTLRKMATPTAEEGFRKMQPRIRSLLKHNRHLPLGMLAGMEEELCFLLSVSPEAVVLTLQTNPFCRLLLHGISQYMGLKSATECVCDGESVVVIECGHGTYSPPATPLSEFLSRSRTHHESNTCKN